MMFQPGHFDLHRVLAIVSHGRRKPEEVLMTKSFGHLLHEAADVVVVPHDDVSTAGCVRQPCYRKLSDLNRRLLSPVDDAVNDDSLSLGEIPGVAVAEAGTITATFREVAAGDHDYWFAVAFGHRADHLGDGCVDRTAVARPDLFVEHSIEDDAIGGREWTDGDLVGVRANSGVVVGLDRVH